MQTRSKKTNATMPLKLFFLFFCVFSVLQTSCVRHPDLLYFRNASEYKPVQGHSINVPDRMKIKTDDILSIIISSLEPKASLPFNLFPIEATLRNNNPTLSGYLVDPNGFIDFPVIGKIKVGGLSTEDVKNVIAKELEPYLNSPTVNVRFMNFRFSVLGEVKTPGTITVSGERITILEAIGQAGDMTSYSNRNNIMIIRESSGNREIGYIDTQSPELFQSPYFYLQQNDVIYVEPMKQKTASIRDPLTETVSIVSSLLSLAAIVISLTR